MPKPSAIKWYNGPSFIIPLSLYHPILRGHGGTSTKNKNKNKKYTSIYIYI